MKQFFIFQFILVSGLGFICGSKAHAEPGLGIVGTRCVSNLTCGGDAYCEFSEGSCGEHGTAGKCQDRPNPKGMCTQVVVCGCDGKKYGTPCAAAAAGVSIKSSSDLSYCEKKE